MRGLLLAHRFAGLSHNDGVLAEGHQHQLLDGGLFLGDQVAVGPVLGNAALCQQQAKGTKGTRVYSVV